MVPSEFGGAEGLLLAYVTYQSCNPLACVSAVLMALRAEVRRRGEGATAALQVSLDRFHELQVSVVGGTLKWVGGSLLLIRQGQLLMC